MIKYKITITKIEVKKVVDSVYISDDEIARRRANTEKGDSYPTKNYQDVEVEKTVNEDIYEQTTDGQIDLKEIIDAFNKQPVGGGSNGGPQYGGGGGGNQ